MLIQKSSSSPSIMMSFFIIITVIIISDFTSGVRAQASNPTIEFTMLEEESSGFKVGSIANRSKPYLETNITDLLYNFLSQTEAQVLFSINDQTGDIFTIVKIDREHVCKEYDTICKISFDVGVSSTDLQFFQIVSVNIFIEDVNDNAPLFPTDVYKLNISESSHVGSTFTIEQAIDRDTGANNSIQGYELKLDEVSRGFFNLSVTKNLDQRFSLKLVLDIILDRETTERYSLTIEAKDGGSPPKTGLLTIIVNVLDTNDNAPEFTANLYNKTVKENTAAMETILTLSATDKDIGENARISYGISKFQKDIIYEIFEIVSGTGELKVKSDLTSLAGQFYRFYVDATDHGTEPLFSQSEVEIHIEDFGNNAPKVSVSFLTPGNTGFVNISENAKNATFVAHVNVEDPDKGLNGEVDCRISNNHFAIVRMDKGFKVVVNTVLDREVLNIYNLTVTCFDKGTPVMSASASFTVRITDYNDNKPVFSKPTYTAKIKENNIGNEMLLQVTATDADIGNNADIHFAPDEDVNGRFIIDRNTGVISVNDIFDRETEPVITFRVLAIDNGSPVLTGTATIVLTITDENDNTPTFKKSVNTFEILENQPTGTNVGQLDAVDLDQGANAEFDFSISQEYVDTVPFVVFSNGLIKANKQLDREERSRYDFVALVTDRADPSRSSVAQVTIKVLDVNDNKPVLTFPRPSNNSITLWYPDFPNSYVTTIEAYDLDEGRNKQLEFSIVGGNDLEIFSIEKVSGVITIAKQIDIKADTHVMLDISVRDQGDFPLETVRSLFVELKYTNSTFLASASGPANSKYIIISVVVVIVTLIVSGVIIGVILFLRTLDKRRKEKVANDSSTTIESDFGFTPTQSHTIISAETLSSGSGEGHDLIKKKEVSFVLENNDSYDYHQQKQMLTQTPSKDKPSKSSLRYSPQQFVTSSPPTSAAISQSSGERSPGVLDTRELQHEANVQLSSMKLKQMMLQSRAKQWVEQQQQQYGSTVPLPHDDHTSEGSAETIGSDSGRGCSEEDDLFSTPSGDDPKLFDISSPESGRSSYLSPNKEPLTSTQLPPYVKQQQSVSSAPWTRKPQMNSTRIHKPSHSQLCLNRNLNMRHSVHLDSVSSITDSTQNPRMSWGSTATANAFYGSGVLPMDYTGDSQLHSFFDKTPVAYNYRDDEDSCSTTTSGSYTIYSEEVL